MVKRALSGSIFSSQQQALSKKKGYTATKERGLLLTSGYRFPHQNRILNFHFGNLAIPHSRSTTYSGLKAGTFVVRLASQLLLGALGLTIKDFGGMNFAKMVPT